MLSDCMEALTQPESKRFIRERAGLGNGQRFDRAWAAMLTDRFVVEDGTVTRGNKQQYPAFRLARKWGEV